MARLAYIYFTPHRVLVLNGNVKREAACQRPVDGLPQIIWNDSTPWREANIWALERISESIGSLRTVQATFSSLLRYANWLEMTGTSWWHFPTRKRDRCLDRFRHHLISERQSGAMAPSTASQTMSQVIRFYRWLFAMGFFAPETPLWTERSHSIRFTDRVGAERSVTVQSTDLAIRNRRAPGTRLEDGLVPVSALDRDVILKTAKEHCSEELFLMLELGFFTGMRLGTLTDLKITSLEHAVRDARAPELYQLAIGPGAYPPVKTKFSVTGHALIMGRHLAILKEYAYGVHRLKREARARPEDRDIIFLTRFGRRYASHDGDRSNAINVEMHHLRSIGKKLGISVLSDFHFHQSRCTFATAVAEIAMKVGGDIAAIALVKDLLLHKSESTTVRYIKFVKETPIRVALGDEFTRQFFGLTQQRG